MAGPPALGGPPLYWYGTALLVGALGYIVFVVVDVWAHPRGEPPVTDDSHRDSIEALGRSVDQVRRL